jgi:MiaB/RimO family radical SAM methylthiotransferase
MKEEKMAQILFKSIGCTENDYFLSSLISNLNTVGYACDFKPTNRSFIDFDTRKRYDALVFGSCTVAGYCDDFMLRYISMVKKYNPLCLIIVCGCSVNNKESFERLSGSGLIDHFITEKKRIKSLIRTKIKADAKRKKSDGASPYIMVKSGCNNHCSYCIVPFVRKPFRSVPCKKILAEIKNKEKKGVKKIILSGACIGDWSDSSERMDFAGLLNIILVKTNVSIHEIYLNPKDMNTKLINLLKEDRISKYFYIPIQSGSDKILKDMKRGYTVKFLKKTLTDIRKKIPGCRIDTDILIGFPTETDRQFKETLSFLKQAHFDLVRGLIYSSRPGTEAAKLVQISKQTKMARARELIEFCSKNKISVEVPGLGELELSNLR